MKPPLPRFGPASAEPQRLSDEVLTAENAEQAPAHRA